LARGSYHSRSKIYCNHPDWPWGPLSLLYDGYQVSFPEKKWPWGGVDHPLPSSAEVKEKVELYLYSLSRPSCPVIE